jgi:hypothetical protein
LLLDSASILRIERIFGDISMLGSTNLRRGNVPLAMRLKIEDLHARLAPLDRYGLPGFSSAITDGVRALARGFKGALLALCCGEV